MRVQRFFKSLCLVTLVVLTTASAVAGPAQGQPAHPFKAQDVRGQAVDLEELLGTSPQLLILFFFSIESGQRLAVGLREVDGKYANVVAVGLEDDENALKRFATQFNISYHVVKKPPEVEYYSPFPVLPVTYFIAPDKLILNVLQGGGEGQADVITRVANIYLQRGDAGTAKAAAEKAIESGEDKRAAGSTIAYANVVEGKLDEAESEFGKLDAKDGLARVALERGDLDRAVALADEAGPENAYAQAIKGEALLRAGKLDEAAPAFDAAVSGTGEDWQLAEAYGGRGRLRQQAGQLESARGDLEQAVALDPYNVKALSNQSATYRQQGHVDEAAKVLTAARERGIDDALMAMTLRQIEQDMRAGRDAQRKELIRQQVADLGTRYQELKEAGMARPVDEWTSRPLVLALLPGEKAGPAFFDRAGTDLVLRREIMDRLNENDRMRVVDRETLDTLLQELNLGSSELADPNTQLLLGRVFAAQLLGFVEFAGVGADTTMFIRLVDTETTAIDSQVTCDVSNPDEAEGVVSGVAEELTRKVIANRPLQGLVAEISGEDVLINLGAGHGVRQGMEFGVFEGGGTVEVGGRVLHRRMTRVGALRVQEVEEEVSVCQLVDGSLKAGVVLAKEMKLKELPAQP